MVTTSTKNVPIKRFWDLQPISHTSFPLPSSPSLKRNPKWSLGSLYSFWDERKENSYLEIEGIFFIPLTYGVLYYYSVMFSNVFLTLVSLIFLVLSLGKRYACAGPMRMICSYLQLPSLFGDNWCSQERLWTCKRTSDMWT